MPAFRHSSRSCAMALAVRATIGMALPPSDCSRLRISAVASKPSISGMWQSIRIRSNEPPRGASSASLPLVATVTLVALQLQDAERHLLVDEVVLDQQDVAAHRGRSGARRPGQRRAPSTGSCARPAIAFTRHSYSTVWRTGLTRQASKPASRALRTSAWRRVSMTSRRLANVGAPADAARELERVQAGHAPGR